MPPTNQPAPKPGGLMEQLIKVSAIGTNFAFAIIGMGVLGYGVDYLAGTLPTWTLVGIVLGFLGGGYRFFKEAMAASKASARSSRRTDGKPGPDGSLYRKIEDPEDKP